MSVQAIIEGVIGREGSYSNNPADAGGETMWGITIAVARSYGYTGQMRDMPRDVAAQIYLKQYFMDPGFHAIFTIHSGIAEKMVDQGVNCGVKQPAKWLQRTLNCLNRGGKLYADVAVDGDAGQATRFALQSLLQVRGEAGARAVIKALNCLQGAHYIDITERRAANEEFVFGWLTNRVQG